jgi:cytochrome oxidase Cu insertion factor (SCO1/SenC/PrrC family)
MFFLVIWCLSKQEEIQVGIFLSVGDRAPDFELRNQKGRPVRLSGLKGKYVVIFFYGFDWDDN